jgi:Domain of unknown function (DUF4397)
MHSNASALVLASVFIISVLSGWGCGGSGMTRTAPPPVQETATLVVVLGISGNSFPQSSVAVDGQIVADHLAWPSSTNPLAVEAGTRLLQIQDSGSTMLGTTLNATVTLSANAHYTLVRDGTGFIQVGLLFTDDTAPAGGTNAKLRVIDAAETQQGSVDVYVMPAGMTPSGTPSLTGLIFNGNISQSPYQLFPQGSYDVFFTTAGTTQVLYHTGAIILAANQTSTVILLNLCTVGGGCNLAGPFASLMVAD